MHRETITIVLPKEDKIAFLRYADNQRSNASVLIRSFILECIKAEPQE